MSALRNENVCRLDVSMDYASRMGGIDSISHLDGKIEHRFDLQWLSADPVF